MAKKEKTSKTVSIIVTPTELDIVDKLRRKHYTLNQSEVYRMLINEGAKTLLDKKAHAQTGA